MLLPLNLDQINGALISEIVTARKAAGASVATIRRDLTALSSVLGFAEANEWREGNPALSWLRRLRERRDPIRLPEQHSIDRIVARVPGMLPALIRAARATGCRLDELVSAKRSQFDRTRRQLTVYGKGNKARVIDLEPFGAFAIFDSLPAYLAEPWLFWHSQGEPYKNVSSRFSGYVKAELAAAVEAAGPGRTPAFRPFGFHHLRHLHAVEWLKSGRNIYDLQQRMGHASIKTTEIYLAFLTADEIRTVKYGASGPAAQQQQTG